MNNDSAGAVKQKGGLKTGFSKSKFLFALIPCGLFAFMYFFFGPTELVYSNKKDMAVDILQTTPYFTAAFIAVALLTAALVSLFKDEAYDNLLKFIVGFSVASYLQSLFFNVGFDWLDGVAIQWQLYAAEALLNLALWVAVIFAMWPISKMLKSNWKKAVCGVCALLFIMQGSGAVMLYVNELSRASEYSGAWSDEAYFLTSERQFDVSKNDNVIVFCLDACSNRVVMDMAQDYSDALDSFSDFTYFNNCAPIYYGTFPEVVVMLTGNDRYDPEKSYEDYFEQSWSAKESVDFYGLLKNNEYERYVFESRSFITDRYSLVSGKIDNAVPQTEYMSVNAAELYLRVENLTLYRYLPIALKACFWSTPNDYIAILNTDSVAALWYCGEREWADGLENEGINLVDENVFSFYHFHGAHGPFNMNERAEYIGQHNDRVMHVRGAFSMIADYIDRLKTAGVYDSSTIIILADHGDYSYEGSTASSSTVFMIKRKNETHAKMEISNAPITHMELIPTIVSEVEPEAAKRFGETVFDIDENAVRDRTLYRWYKIDDLKPGNYDSFYAFYYDCHINELNDLTKPDEIIPLADSFY